MNLEDLSRTDLEEQAKLLDVKFTAATSDETLRNRIAEKLGEPVQAPVDVRPKGKKDKDKEEDHGQRISIILSESESDRRPVVVGVNGKNYVMKRGVPVSVPMAVIEVLNNACNEVFDSEMKVSQQVMRFPYRVVG